METIIGMGIVIFMLLYVAFSLEKKHFVLQLFLLFISFFMLILVAKAALDPAQACDLVINTTTVAGNTTSYTYMQECSRTDATEVSFYKAVLWIVRIVSLYIVLYFLYSVFNWFAKNGKNKQE